MHKRLRIVRVETTSDNRHIVGLLVPNAAVETVLQGFFLSPHLPPFLKSTLAHGLALMVCFHRRKRKYFPLQLILCSDFKKCCYHAFQSIT